MKRILGILILVLLLPFTFAYVVWLSDNEFWEMFKWCILGEFIIAVISSIAYAAIKLIKSKS